MLEALKGQLRLAMERIEEAIQLIICVSGTPRQRVGIVRCHSRMSAIVEGSYVDEQYGLSLDEATDGGAYQGMSCRLFNTGILLELRDPSMTHDVHIKNHLPTS